MDSKREHLVERICICSLRSLIVLSFSEILSRQASRSILRDSFANLYGSVARLVFCLGLTAFGLLGSAVETVTGIEVMGKVVGVGEEETVEAADTTE